jgi:hypothetical protein
MRTTSSTVRRSRGLVVAGQEPGGQEAGDNLAPGRAAQGLQQGGGLLQHLGREPQGAVEGGHGGDQLGPADGQLDGDGGPAAVADDHASAQAEDVAEGGGVLGKRRDAEAVLVGRDVAVAVAGQVEADHPVGGGEGVGQPGQVGPPGAPAVQHEHGRPGRVGGVVVGQAEPGPLEALHLRVLPCGSF